MSFLHSGLLAGALLFAVPLIIHLLNRQRYRRRNWAAMEFLLRAYKKNRRRLRTENLLLLLLRCLIPIIIALAIARPIFESGPNLGFGGSAHHVIVLDQSYSMGLQPEGDTSPFERAKNDAVRLIDRIAKRSGQKVTVVFAGIRTTVPVQEDMNYARAKAAIARLGAPQDSAADLTDALNQTADLVESSAEAEIRVYLFTDLQQRSFGEDPFGELDPEDPRGKRAPVPVDPTQDPGATEKMFEDSARDAIGRLIDKADFTVLDVGGIAKDATPGHADNLQVTDVRLAEQIAVVRNPVTIEVHARNRTGKKHDLQVTLEKDGGEPVRKSLSLEAGADGHVEFDVTFLTVGPHSVQASIEGDGLDADNSRYLIVQVRERGKLLMVEGSDEIDPELTESEHMRSVLDPTGGEGSPDLTVFQPRVVRYVDFLLGTQEFEDHDVVVLANVREMNRAVAQSLKDAVRSGTGLFIMLGDRVDPASYNLHLHDVGRGPMPIALTEPAGYTPRGQQYHGSRLDVPDHPLLVGFSGTDEETHRALLADAQLYRYWTSTEPEVEDRDARQVLMRVRDTDLSPLLVASSFGEGKTITLTTSISRRPDRWNEWNMLIVSLPLFHEGIRWLSLPTTDPFNARVGSVLTANVRYQPRDVNVVLPERAGGRPIPLYAIGKPLDDGKRFALPPFRDTEHAGIYRVETRKENDVEGSGVPLFFAVNPDADEGDLRYLAHDVARDRLGIQRILRELPSEGSADLPTGRSDFGMPLLWLALFFVLGEAMLAHFVTRRRNQ